jgi:imidazolonepropionase-like amidohydrolase
MIKITRSYLFRCDKEIGTVEKGKIANLVLINGNFENI